SSSPTRAGNASSCARPYPAVRLSPRNTTSGPPAAGRGVAAGAGALASGLAHAIVVRYTTIMTTAAPRIELIGLTRRLPSGERLLTILDRIDLSIAPGEFAAV